MAIDRKAFQIGYEKGWKDAVDFALSNYQHLAESDYDDKLAYNLEEMEDIT